MFTFKKMLVLLFTLSSSIINNVTLLYCDARPICENLSHLHAQYAQQEQQSVNTLHTSNDIKYIPNLSKAGITNSYNTHIYPVVSS